MAKRPKRSTSKPKSKKKGLQISKKRLPTSSKELQKITKKVLNTPKARRMVLEQIEEKLAAQILKANLALYLLKNSRKPMSSLVDEMFDIEMQVGNFFSEIVRSGLKSSLPKPHRLLASALSYIQFPTSAPKRKPLAVRKFVKPKNKKK